MKKRLLSAAVASLLPLSCLAPRAWAMQFHLHGSQAVLSGDVNRSDVVMLSALLEKARKQGHRLDTVVLRTSNGGDLFTGEYLQAVIRQAGLNTVVSGHCISSCSIMQSGGVGRYFGHDGYYIDSVQFHAAHNEEGMAYEESPNMLAIFNHNYDGKMDPELLHKALFEVTQPDGLLRFYDPNDRDPSVTFDPDGTGGKVQTFPAQDIYRNNILTGRAYHDPGDTLHVRGQVQGDINPNYLRSNALLDGFASNDALKAVDGRYRESYLNVAFNISSLAKENGTSILEYLSDPGVQQLLQGLLKVEALDPAVLADSWGQIVVDRGADWRLGAAQTGADGIRVAGGRVSLGGGALRTQLLAIARDGIVVGHGDIAGLDYDNEAFFAGHGSIRQDGFARILDSGLLYPRDGILTARGYVNILDGGTLAFDLLPDGGGSALRIAPYGSTTGNNSALVVEGRPLLALNVAHGFYRAGQSHTLVDGPVVSFGAFAQAVSLDDPNAIAQLDSADPGKRTFHPTADALLSFGINITDTGIVAVANPAFDDTSVFADAASGEGLGVALREASHREGSPLQPLLGALQFSSRAVARGQAGALRGDGQATLRLADVAMVQAFGGEVERHLLSLRSRGQDAGGLAAAGSYATGTVGLGGPSAGDVDGLMMYLAEPASPSRTSVAADGLQFWGRGFGQNGRIAANEGVARMNYTIGGVMLGADRGFSDDRVVFGGHVGFAQMSANTQPGRPFHGDVDGLNLGVHLEADHALGFLSVSARYTRMDHETDRSIVGIEGLEAASHADYRNHAISAHLENGFRLGGEGGATWQPLLPVVDYAKLSATTFREHDGAAPLGGSAGDLESIRAGAGLQVWKAFAARGGEIVVPHARVLWQKELGDTRARFLSAFAVEPDLDFGVASQSLGEDVLSWNLGVNSRASERLSLLLDYAGQRVKGRIDHGIALGLGYRF